MGVSVGPPEAADPAEFTDTDGRWMQRALALAAQAGEELDEVPVGAVVVGPDGALLAETSNLAGDRHDPSAHAELLAVAAAGKALGNKRLTGCTMYVSLEPCPMCASALVHARVSRLVFAAASPKTGAAGSLFGVLGDYGGADLADDHRHNHRVVVKGGLMADEAGRLLSDWFRRKRDAAR
ncbi:tRNA adenosine(34) deaminase TadA [Arenimonas terrae]|uniref:tRNA adenosine(34) deaminase TadA n=1 Tax=Arenimonas terrae TaxID=2546226 RepID=UPI003CCC8310